MDVEGDNPRSDEGGGEGQADARPIRPVAPHWYNPTPINAIYKPATAKASIKDKTKVPTDDKTTADILAVVIGLEETPLHLVATDKQFCYSCKHYKEKKSAVHHVKVCCQMNEKNALIRKIKTMSPSPEKSPLVKWDTTALFLHLCIWLAAKLCTCCTSSALNYFYENFTKIIDLMLQKYTAQGIDESEETNSWALKWMEYVAARMKKCTGSDSLGGGIVSKSGSGKFIAYFLFSIMKAKNEISWPTTTEIMQVRTSAMNKLILDAKVDKSAGKMTANHEKKIEDIKQSDKAKQGRVDLFDKRKLETENAHTFVRKTKIQIQFQKRLEALPLGVDVEGGSDEMEKDLLNDMDSE